MINYANTRVGEFRPVNARSKLSRPWNLTVLPNPGSIRVKSLDIK
jgi:hypothetical protein